MRIRTSDLPMMAVPLLLLLGVFFPLLLYILPLLFFSTLVCLYSRPQGDVPVSNRNTRHVSSPRGPPCHLLFS